MNRVRQCGRLAAWLAAIGLCGIAPAPSPAQSLDYGRYEQLFGEPVTDSATGQPQRASDVPADMQIITQDDIRRSGATNIPDVLQYVAGVDVRRYGLDDSELGIRGYNQAFNPRLLVLVNGRQVYADDYGHVDWATIPVQLEEIRQIEVIKGPNSALYGFNAVGGVINIITYDPLRDKLNVATLRAGTQDERGGSLVATAGTGDNLAIRLSAGGLRADDFPVGGLPPADTAARLPPLADAFNLEAKARLGPDTDGFLAVSNADARHAETDFAGGFDTMFARTNAVQAGITADTRFGLLSVGAYRNGETLSIFSPILAGIPNWTTEAVTVAKASDLLKLNAGNSLRLGVEYRRNTLTAPGFVQGTIGYQVYAADAMWNWQITPSLSLTNAVRADTLRLAYSGQLAAGTGQTLADYHRAGFTVPSFNTGLVYDLTDQDTLRLMLAQGVQVPSLVDFGLQMPAGQLVPAVVAGNPALRPSIVRNIELDYDRMLLRLRSTMRLALFVQRSDDVISQPYAVTPTIGPTGLPVLEAANVGYTQAIGGELGIRGHAPSGWRWNASYAFAATTNHTTLSVTAPTTNPVDYAHAAPRHVVVLGLGYSRGPWEADVMGRWQSGYRDFATTGVSLLLQPVTIPAYLTVNARIGYRIGDHVLLSVTAQQFNAATLVQTAGPPVERRFLVAVTVRY